MHRASWLSFFSSNERGVSFRKRPDRKSFLGADWRNGEIRGLYSIHWRKKGGVFASVKLFGIGADTLLQEEGSSLF